MKFLITLLIPALMLPSVANAGWLFGDRIIVHNYGASPGYVTQYGYSESFPGYRTYRFMRGPVQQGYWVPPPQADYSEPVVDDGTLWVTEPAVSVKHKERYRHGRVKISHKETTR